MLQDERTALRVGEVSVSPLQQAGDHGLQIQALTGQVVLEPRRVFLVLTSFQHAVLEQALEARCEHVARDAEMLLHLVESARTQEELAQDQQAPGIAEHLQGAGDGASSGIEDRVGAHETADSLAK